MSQSWLPIAWCRVPQTWARSHHASSRQLFDSWFRPLRDNKGQGVGGCVSLADGSHPQLASFDARTDTGYRTAPLEFDPSTGHVCRPTSFILNFLSFAKQPDWTRGASRHDSIRPNRLTIRHQGHYCNLHGTSHGRTVPEIRRHGTDLQRKLSSLSPFASTLDNQHAVPADPEPHLSLLRATRRIADSVRLPGRAGHRVV